MRRNRSRVGQMRVVEVIIALFIIVFALSFANLLSITPSSQKYESTDLEKLGYNVLHDLDKQSLLPRFVYNPEWSNLTSALRVSLPLGVYFNVSVCRLDTTVSGDANYVSLAPMFSYVYGDEDIFQVSKDVASVTYCLTGYATGSSVDYQYLSRVVILELTRGENN